MKQEIIDFGKEIASLDIRKTPSYRTLLLLSDKFSEYGLPLKYLGKMSISVGEEFFEDESEVEEYLDNFVSSLKKLHTALMEDFGEEGDKIFMNMASESTLQHP